MNTSDERIYVAKGFLDAAKRIDEIDNSYLCDDPAASRMLAVNRIVGWQLGRPNDYTFTRLAELIDPTCKPVITVESLTESLTKYTSECSECGAIFGDFPTREQAETTHPTYCPCCGSRVITPNSGKDTDSEC